MINLLIKSVLLKGRSEYVFFLIKNGKRFNSSNYRDDGKIELVFKKKKGEYAGVHAIYVYRYEKEAGEEGEEIESGVQAYSRRGNSGLIVPTVIKGNGIRLLNIPYKKAEIQIFDIVGRRVYTGILKNGLEIPFRRGSGSYILIIRDLDTGEKVKRKLIRVR